MRQSEADERGEARQGGWQARRRSAYPLQKGQQPVEPCRDLAQRRRRVVKALNDGLDCT